MALGSFTVIYAIGIVVPYLTHSPLFLNLHLLRVIQCSNYSVPLVVASRDPLVVFGEADGVQFFGADAGTFDVRAGENDDFQPALHATAAFLAVTAAQFPAARQFVPEWLCRPTLRLRVWASAIVVASFAIVIGDKALNNLHEGQRLTEWRTVGQSARSNTSPKDVFLVLTWNFRAANLRKWPSKVKRS